MIRDIDLTDEQLDYLVGRFEVLSAANRTAYVDASTLELAALAAAAAREVQRHRLTVGRIKALRDSWAGPGSADREWLGEAFVDELNEAIDG